MKHRLRRVDYSLLSTHACAISLFVAAACCLNVKDNRMQTWISQQPFNLNVIQELLTTHQLNPTNSSESINGRYTTDPNACSNVTLTREEYWIKNSQIITIYASDVIFNLTDVVLKDENVTLCFPYTLHFSQCIKWKFSLEEIFIYTNRTLVIFYSNNHIEFGDYRITSGRSVVVCVPDELLKPFFALDLYFLLIQIISTLFLFTSFLSYVICPFRRYDSKAVICHMACGLMFYIPLVLTSIIPMQKKSNRIIVCWLEFTELTGQCWLTIIYFDMWRKFHPPRRIIVYIKPNPAMMFFKRCFYACAVPFTIVMIDVFIEQYATLLIKEHPGFRGNFTQTVVHFVFTVVINVVNLNFFIFTPTQEKASSDADKLNAEINKHLMSIYKNLMIVTCTVIAARGAGMVVRNVSFVWVFTDTVATLQGFFLFLVFGCKSLTMMTSQCSKMMIS